MSDQMTPSGLSCRRCSWSRLSFNASARTEHYTPSLHDALPISVAQSTRRRSVRKHVAEMSAAVAAMHFGARHPVAAIDGRPDAALQGREEARPAGATLELAIGDEQLLTAGRARKGSSPLFLQQRTRSGRFGGVIPQDGILLRRQQLAPFLIRLGDGKCRFVHVPSMP